MGARYSFVSRWQVEAGPERTWDTLERMLRPEASARPGDSWWPAVRVTDPPSRVAPGEHLTLSVRSPIGYRLRVRLRITEHDPRRVIAAESTGDLHGHGRIELDPVRGGTAITFRWDVSTERRWMNATAFVLRPAFVRAHASVMRRGERGLRAAVEDADRG